MNIYTQKHYFIHNIRTMRPTVFFATHANVNKQPFQTVRQMKVKWTGDHLA